MEAATTAVAARQPFTLVITEAEANARLAQAGSPPTLDTPLGPAELRDHPRKAAAKQPAGPAPSRRARAAPAERIPAPKPSRQAARGRKSA